MLKPAIVVTGAASGIGRELARLAAREGSFLLLVDKAQAGLEDIVAELAAGGAEAAALRIDLAERDAGERIEGALSARSLYCDVLVNSAGFGLFGPAAATSRTEQIDLLDVNARALTELTLRFVPGMVARGRGGVINLGSVTGYTPGPNMALYYASKAYVNSFSAALAAELAGTGVTVTNLAPGVVRTAFADRTSLAQTRIHKIAPRSEAPAVAAAGWRAFKAGRRLVIPRLVDRLIAGFCTIMPNAVMLRLVARLQRLPPAKPH